MSMNAQDYDYLVNFLQQSSGLSLGSGKEYLLEARLVPLAQSQGLADFGELIAELRRGTDRRLLNAVTEAMTTNETLFFRDRTPFDDLKATILPRLIAERATSRSLRIWCAAASSGQEPYSLLMLLEESFPELKNWNVEFVATDLSQNILQRAEKGIYSQFEVQRGLPVQLLMKYFEQCSSGWQVKPALRQRVKYRVQNLLENFTPIGPCDLILCRNVLIYFDNDTKRNILDRMVRMMRPAGALILGAAETVLGICDKFQRDRSCKSSVYEPLSKVNV